MLQVTDSKFDRYLELSRPVDSSKITSDSVKYFDNDGFELSCLETDFYCANNVALQGVLNHNCDQKDWLTGGDNHLIVDHSLLLQRWCFVREARDQLESSKTSFPQLYKYLKLIPKWGIDFALEYYNDDQVLEVLHIETDFRNYYEAVAAKEAIQERILSTDWYDFVKSLTQHKSQWEYLNGMEQNDWKAVHWGLKKAEKTYKAF